MIDPDPAVARVAGPDATMLATIWATVDLGRAIHELGARRNAEDDAGEKTTVDPAAALPDPLLGARVVILPATPDRSALAVAEPSTEGRLAATLARLGEGRAGQYVSVGDGLDRARARAAEAGIVLSRVEIGPFGPSMLVLRGPATGPHLILCELAAVPSSP